MKLVITAGGGGHFAPALAVIIQAPKEWEIVLIGRKFAFEEDKTVSLEYTTAKTLGIPFRSLETARLQRKFTIHTLPSFFKLPGGLYQALQILRKEKPDMVLSFGGYISVPVVIAASILKIPIVVHEQTLRAGLSNKIASHFARYICVSWEQSKAYFPKGKTIVTGNPLKISVMNKKDFFMGHVLDKKDAALPVLYVTGGSLGSHPINVFIEGCLEKLLQKYVVVHQTGDAQTYADYDRLLLKKNQLSDTLQKRYILTKFVAAEELGSILKKTTLVIARSGINTVSEMLYFEKPTLFIPLPFSQGNEQHENALFFKRQGLGEVFAQTSLTAEKLYEHIVSMVTHKERYEQKGKSAKSLITIDAAQNILAVCEKSLYDR